MEFDEVLKTYIGQIGLYQILIVLYVSASSVNFAIDFLDVIFTGITPEFRCNVDFSNATDSVLTWDEKLRLSSPWDVDSADGSVTYDVCRVCSGYNYSSMSYEDASELLMRNESCGSVEQCTGWIYSNELLTSSIVTEWDLVCDRKWYVATQQAVMMSGSFTVLIGGWISDRLGRKPLLIGSIILHIIARTAQGLSVHFTMFLVFRFLLAAAAMNIYTVSFTMCIEVVGPKWRVMAGQIPYVFTSVGYIILATVGYFLRDWRVFTLFHLVFAVPFLSYVCFLPESARWLISKQKTQRGTQVLKSMARINKKEVPEKVYKDLKVTIAEQGSFRELFQSFRMIAITLVNTYLWFTASMVYFGISLFLPKLGGNMFISTIISGSLEFPALLYVQLSLNTLLGRKYNSVISFTTCGVSFFILMLMPKGYVALILVFALVGKFAVSAAFSIIYIHTSEMYPTSLRTVSISVCSSLARVGMILAPYVAHLDNISRYLPPTVMGITALLAGILSLTLPETRGTNLPDSISHLSHLNRGQAKYDEMVLHTGNDTASDETKETLYKAEQC